MIPTPTGLWIQIEPLPRLTDHLILMKTHRKIPFVAINDKFCHSRLVTFVPRTFEPFPRHGDLSQTVYVVVRPGGGIMGRFWHDVWLDQEGQDIAEYAVMLAVILVIVVGTVRLIGSNANNVFSQVGSALQ